MLCLTAWAPGDVNAAPPVRRVGLLATGGTLCASLERSWWPARAAVKVDGLLPRADLAAAVARVRATRALKRARKLYTATDFAGCVSMLSITEHELAQHLAGAGGPSAGAHRLLARVNTWLGVCQWAAEQRQAAAASFVRAARLSGAKRLSRTMFPPKLRRFYWRSLRRPREQAACLVAEEIATARLFRDGEPVIPNAGPLLFDRGGSYVSLHRGCRRGQGVCRPAVSWRLNVGDEPCRLRPPQADAGKVACISPDEAKDASFVAQVGRAVRAPSVIVVEQQEGQVAATVSFSNEAHFRRRATYPVGGSVDARQAVGAALEQVMKAWPTLAAREPVKRSATARWYRKWWVWGIVGATVALGATAIGVGVAASGQ